MSDSRSLANALQNINGMSSVLSLIPVLTGKVQNVKMVVSRTFPGTLVLAGLGAGRVLTKLQIGVLLLSSDLYQNLVDQFSYHHNEYINKFSPALVHVPSSMPERHSSNVIINHNPTEDYMIEAWFQTQGHPARVELKQNNSIRVFLGMSLYALVYAAETYLAMRTAATGTSNILIGMHVATGVCWITAVCILQTARGQGKRFIQLNGLNDTEYRCFRLVTLGNRVQSAVLSIHLSGVREFDFFGSHYDSITVKFTGAIILVSAVVDIVSTVLLVGLNRWAYGWLAYQVLIITVKVMFSLEPLRQIAIREVLPLGSTDPSKVVPRIRLPLAVSTVPDFTFLEICTQMNIVLEHATNTKWKSRSPGLHIGQLYEPAAPSLDGKKNLPARYLTLSGDKLTLDAKEPRKESNQALQREFLACLADVVKANKVASREFVFAVEITVKGVRRTMDAEWYAFGSKDLTQNLQKCKSDIFWRTYF